MEKFLRHCNFSTSDLPSCLPSFYGEFFAVWSSLSNTFVSICEQEFNQILWNNQSLRVDKNLFSVGGIISLANIITHQARINSWKFSKATGLNANENFLLVGFCNLLPLECKNYIISTDGAQRDPMQNKYNDFAHVKLKGDTLSLDTTLDTKTIIMIMFQYKVLNRILFTSKLLYKMKIADSVLGFFCKTTEKSLEH